MSCRSTRQLKQDPESKSSVSLWQSVFLREDKVSLLLLNRLSTQVRIFCWQKRVCVCVCDFGRECVPVCFVCVYWGGTDRILGVCSCHKRCQQLWHIVCCLVLVNFFSSRHYFRCLHIYIKHWTNMRRKWKAVKLPPTIGMSFICSSGCSPQLSFFLHLVLIQAKFPERCTIFLEAPVHTYTYCT